MCIPFILDSYFLITAEEEDVKEEANDRELLGAGGVVFMLLGRT